MAVCRRSYFLILIIAFSNHAFAQFTHADSLRGSQSKERTWWDVLKYDLDVTFDPASQSISGSNTITYRITANGPVMQIDLMEPMTIDSVTGCTFTRDGNAWFVTTPSGQAGIQKIKVYYHGVPPVAKQPPWDGGVIWTKDRNEDDWISVACQGFGASCWYPNKDQQLDEPDSAQIHLNVPSGLTAVSNGRLSATKHWKVQNPINNYNIIPYIGKYGHFEEVYKSVGGPLDISYWALEQDLATAKSYWPKELKKTLKTLEKWFGPYPFREDGFKLVQAPHLGMEHQSAIAYGNQFKYGYLGHDLSGSGWGLKWDFIILHETAHEWFGNNITAADIADMWIHEAFATYAEVLYIEDNFGYEAGVDYLVGRRAGIQNDEPIIGPYGVNKEGSGDMYPKGANMIHIIRKIIDNDKVFRNALIAMNKKFYHQQVTTQDVLKFWNSYSPRDLTLIFDQYLKQAQPPTLDYTLNSNVMRYKWENCVPGFDMPVKIDGMWIYPTSEFKETKLKKTINGISREFYVLH
jgi:aminopeptidase N